MTLNAALHEDLVRPLSQAFDYLCFLDRGVSIDGFFLENPTILQRVISLLRISLHCIHILLRQKRWLLLLLVVPTGLVVFIVACGTMMTTCRRNFDSNWPTCSLGEHFFVLLLTFHHRVVLLIAHSAGLQLLRVLYNGGLQAVELGRYD